MGHPNMTIPMIDLLAVLPPQIHLNPQKTTDVTLQDLP
jgi:hypothetical protein